MLSGYWKQKKERRKKTVRRSALKKERRKRVSEGAHWEKASEKGKPGTCLLYTSTDARGIGIKAPVRESGKLEGTPGCKLVGPCGEVELDHGVIAALRHVHLNDEQAAEAGVKDGDVVSIKIEGERGLIFDNVLVRAGAKHEREVHLDTDEGNAAGCGPDAVCEIIK